jgi:isopentenyl-diphosphate delta-isomerase
MIDNVILVDELDNEMGTMEKIEAHEKGILHRAFSIFIFNEKHEMLLQKRAESKYHSAGLWSNSCCSHPKPGENLSTATNRRLVEEMGLTCNLNFAFSFIYKVEFDNGLTEHELDHVFIGQSNSNPIANQHEVSEWKYMNCEAIQEDLKANPENYTEWFKICFKRLHSHLIYPYLN